MDKVLPISQPIIVVQLVTPEVPVLTLLTPPMLLHQSTLLILHVGDVLTLNINPTPEWLAVSIAASMPPLILVLQLPVTVLLESLTNVCLLRFVLHTRIHSLTLFSLC